MELRAHQKKVIGGEIEHKEGDYLPEKWFSGDADQSSPRCPV